MLFHSVVDTYLQDVVVFAWHPDFDDQASMVMSGLLPYLKNEYGESVKQYFNEDCITMQDLQKWDKDKGGIVNEDDAMMSEFANSSSWWDVDQAEKTEKTIVVDVSKVVTTETITKNDDASLPTVNTKEENPNDIQLPGLSKVILNKSVPQMENPKDTATVTSALTLDDVASRMDEVATRMTTYEGSVHSMQTEVAAIHNSMNHNQILLQAICAKLELNGTTNTNGVSGDQS